MHESNSQVNPLELQKKMLIAESELNRAQLFDGLVELRHNARSLGGFVKAFDLVPSSIEMLVATLAAFRKGRATDGSGSSSWVQTFLKAAGVLSTVWMAFRPRSRNQSNK